MLKCKSFLHLLFSALTIFCLKCFPQDLIELQTKGYEALQKRIHLIQNAKHSIKIETYIFDQNAKSTILILQELVKKSIEQKSNPNFKIQLLIDHGLFSQPISKYLVRYLKDHGIEVKLFNPSYFTEYPKVNYRNHRKQFIIDGAYAIVGGRNFADEYFDLGTNFNFIDKDLLIYGSTVSKIEKSFDKTYTSKFSKLALSAETPQLKDIAKKYQIQTTASTEADFILSSDQKNSKFALAEYKALKEIYNTETKNINQALQNFDISKQITKELNFLIASQPANPKFVCNQSNYFYDLPKLEKTKNSSANYVSDLINNSTKEIVIENSYFIPQEEMNLFSVLNNKTDIKFKLYTNSLISTDVKLVSVASFKYLKGFLTDQSEIYLFQGTAKNILSDSSLNHFYQSKNWRLHSKVIVSDKNHTLISSYNLDPRSFYFNLENGYACLDNPRFAEFTASEIESIKADYTLLNDTNFKELQNQGKNIFSFIKFTFLKPAIWLFEDLL